MSSAADFLKLLPAVPRAKRWVKAQAQKHAHSARPVASFGFQRLGDYFSEALLDAARAIITDDFPTVPLEEWGITTAPEFASISAAGVTFGDSFYVRPEFADDESLFFHELVHVVQARRVGLSRFLALYGLFLLMHDYTYSPLEVMARDLQHAFTSRERFDAADVVGNSMMALLSDLRRQSLPLWLGMQASAIL
jgi:hypothetical protein